MLKKSIPVFGLIFCLGILTLGCGKGAEEVPATTTTTTTTTTTVPHSISGSVSYEGSSALAKVAVSLTGEATKIATTDASGNYSFSDLLNGTYYLTPGKVGYLFTPEAKTVALSGADSTGNNFTSALASWEVMNSGISQDLKAVCFSGLSETITSTTHAYAVGNNGTFIKTTDGGQSWSSVASPTPESLVYVTTGGGSLIAGSKAGKIYKTQNLTPASVNDWATWFNLSTYLTTDLKNCFMGPVSPTKIGIYALESNNGNLHYLVASRETGAIMSHEAVTVPAIFRAMTGRIDSSPGTVTYEVTGVTEDGKIYQMQKINDPTLTSLWPELSTTTQYSPAGENLNCVSILGQTIWIGSSTGAIFVPPAWTEKFSGAPYSFNGLTPLNVSDMTNFLAVGDGGLILRHK